jgi:hypothetical protein
MLNLDQINEIHRLAGGEHWSMRRIACQLHMAAGTVKKPPLCRARHNGG